MLDPLRIAPIRDETRQSLGDPKPVLGLGQEHDATVRRQAPTVESGGDLLAANGWKRKRWKGIVRHGGCGTVQSWQGLVSATKPYDTSVT
jgi:hypothetical protein